MHALLVLVTPLLLGAEPQPSAFREPFLNLCDAIIPVLDDTSRKVPYYVDSYAVRGLTVAYDMTGKKAYLDALPPLV